MLNYAKAAMLAMCLLFFPVSHAESGGYPNRPLRLIVPFPPGGSTDILARLVAERLSVDLGQTVVVENKAGAGGNIGMDAAAKAPADGYTLVIGSTNTFAVNPSLYKQLPYDSVKDFTPIVALAYVANVLVVNPSVPAHNTQELIGLLRKSPDKYNFASPGNGNSSHLAGELFKMQADVKMTHVPYKGDMPAIADLIGGQVQVMFATAGVILPQIRAGKVRPLGIAGPHRLAALPDVPAISESGLPGFDASAWFGISTQAAVPKDIVARLNQSINRIIQSAEFRAQLDKLSATPGGGSAQDYGVFVAAEREKWAKVVKAAGVQVD